MKSPEINKKFLWLVTIPIIFMITAQILGKAVSLAHYNNLFNRFTDYRFIIAYLCLIFRGLIWLYILKKLPLNYVYPFMSSSYPIILIISLIFFKENITFNKIIGSVLIMAGVTTIGLEE